MRGPPRTGPGNWACPNPAWVAGPGHLPLFHGKRRREPGVSGGESFPGKFHRGKLGAWRGGGGAHHELLGDSTAEPAIPSEGRLFCLRLSLAFRREGLSPSSSTSAHKPVIEMACPSSRDFLIMHADSENRPCSSGKRDVGHERERYLDYQQVLHSRYPRVDGIGLREQGTGYGPQCASPSHTLRPRGRRGQLRHLFAPTRR